MKNLIFTCLIFTSFSLLAQEKRLDWDYPVKPGDKQWAELKTGEQQLNAVQIPQNILEQLSTAELAELCLNYPLYIGYTAVNDGRLAISRMIKKFNGLNELSKRKDGAKELVNLYEKFPIFKDKESEDLQRLCFRLPFVELLIANEAFMNQFDRQAIKGLKKLLLKNMAKKPKALMFTACIFLDRHFY